MHTNNNESSQQNEDPHEHLSLDRILHQATQQFPPNNISKMLCKKEKGGKVCLCLFWNWKERNHEISAKGTKEDNEAPGYGGFVVGSGGRRGGEEGRERDVLATVSVSVFFAATCQ